VTILRLLYCALGCVLGGAVLDGAALAFALAFAFFFFFGVVSAPGVAGGRTRILLGLSIRRRQQRGGGYREPSGQSRKQKYFSTRNLVFTHWQEPSLSAPPNPSWLTLKTGI
jgi:hypothetical protein